MRLVLRAFFGFLLVLASAASARADVFRPGYLELRELPGHRYDVMWKVPAQPGVRLAIHVRFPVDTHELTPPSGVFVGGAYVERWRIQREAGLVGETLRLEGIASDVTDVIVRIQRLDGTSQLGRLRPGDAEMRVEASAGAFEVGRSYLVLGIEHIWGGLDHLLFVLSLLLVVRGGRRILLTVTAFTLAHSVTLVSATLGWVRVPGPPVEAVIALSIVFVAAEVVHGLRGREGLTARAPWVVAFSFGLLHGFGFAGALAEVGLPQSAVPLALLMFNIGVEIGQLLFVLAMLALGAVIQRVRLLRAPTLRYLPPYAIGALAVFWCIERVAAF
jgi:hydrogenase/urease accessory protein HupE